MMKEENFEKLLSLISDSEKIPGDDELSKLLESEGGELPLEELDNLCAARKKYEKFKDLMNPCGK